MASDTSRDRLVLSIEDASIAGDGNDMTRITFRALDAYGNQRPYVTGDVTLAVAGPATLIAENPFAFATYGGVGGGFIRSQPGTSGTVTVTATHPTLGQASGSLVIAPATEAKFDSGAPVTASPTPPTTSPGPPTPAAPPQSGHSSTTGHSARTVKSRGQGRAGSGAVTTGSPGEDRQAAAPRWLHLHIRRPLDGQTRN